MQEAVDKGATLEVEQYHQLLVHGIGHEEDGVPLGGEYVKHTKHADRGQRLHQCHIVNPCWEGNERKMNFSLHILIIRYSARMAFSG